jgi:hypothetical protein
MQDLIIGSYSLGENHAGNVRERRYGYDVYVGHYSDPCIVTGCASHNPAEKIAHVGALNRSFTVRKTKSLEAAD